MSRDGQSAADDSPSEDVVVCTFAMPAGAVFDWHTHEDHQLAWAAHGVLTVRSETTAWVLPPTRALWIPAGVRHETLSEGATTMRTAYVNPATCAIAWAECTPVGVTALMAELLALLEEAAPDAKRHAHAEALLVELLSPVATMTIDVQMPKDDRARQVAESLLNDPADTRTLASWGEQVGASERTLARTFLSDTGLSFGRWRALVRLRASMNALASGVAVATVARDVGYESVSAFIAAFRREIGVTPSSYFRE